MKNQISLRLSTQEGGVWTLSVLTDYRTLRLSAPGNSASVAEFQGHAHTGDAATLSAGPGLRLERRVKGLFEERLNRCELGHAVS